MKPSVRQRGAIRVYRVYALGTLTLGTDTGDGRLATELEGTLLAVVRALRTGGGALVTAVARDTHCCCGGGLYCPNLSAFHSPFKISTFPDPTTNREIPIQQKRVCRVFRGSSFSAV